MKRKPITVAFRAFCLSLLFVMSAFAAAQAAKPMKLTGRVVDPDGFSLVGVTITIKGTTKGVTTDSEGKYELDVNAEDIVVYSYIGYKTQEILDNGPLRFTVKLEFTPLTVKGDSTVVETRLITLDAGSHLNKTVVSYSNLKETLPIVAGIVLHEPDGAVVADAANGYITYVDPTTGPDNGKIFMGAAVPAVVKDAKTVLFSEKEKKERNNADGHVLAVSDYEPGSEYVYYWGFAWDKADIKTADAWNRYMADFAQKVRNPLTVKVN